MTTRLPTLTEDDHHEMGLFLNHILQDFKDGILTQKQVVGALGQIIGAIDKGNYGEASAWFRQGRSTIRQTAR